MTPLIRVNFAKYLPSNGLRTSILGLKILRFGKTVVPVQVRPRAPSSEFTEENPKITVQLQTPQKGERQRIIGSSDATMTPPLTTYFQSTLEINNNDQSGGIMARINIEDQFWLDITDVAAKLGDQDRAIGMTVRFFRYAQEMHKRGKLITEEDFLERFNAALMPNFAKRSEANPKQIEAKGSKSHFSWLEQRIEAGKRGGIKSGEKKRRQIELNSSEPEANRSKPKQIKPSSSSSSSIKKEYIHGFELLSAKYVKTFPKTLVGSKAFERLCDQDEPGLVDKIDRAIDHYASYLNSLNWDRQAKTTFETFLGTKKSGYFWREFEYPPVHVHAAGDICGVAESV